MYVPVVPPYGKLVPPTVVDFDFLRADFGASAAGAQIQVHVQPAVDHFDRVDAGLETDRSDSQEVVVYGFRHDCGNGRTTVRAFSSVPASSVHPCGPNEHSGQCTGYARPDRNPRDRLIALRVYISAVARFPLHIS